MTKRAVATQAQVRQRVRTSAIGGALVGVPIDKRGGLVKDVSARLGTIEGATDMKCRPVITIPRFSIVIFGCCGRKAI